MITCFSKWRDILHIVQIWHLTTSFVSTFEEQTAWTKIFDTRRSSRCVPRYLIRFGKIICKKLQKEAVQTSNYLVNYYNQEVVLKFLQKVRGRCDKPVTFWIFRAVTLKMQHCSRQLPSMNRLQSKFQQAIERRQPREF